MESKPLVPKLRFPEFRQAREWHVRSLGDLFAERQESRFNDLPLLSVTDKEGVIPQEQTNRRDNSNIDRSKYLRVVPGDIAYNTMRMWEGRSALVGLEGVVSPAYTVCKPKAESNSRFFSFYFKTPQLIENFRKLSQGLVKDTLNLKYEAFSKIAALVPSPAEQQKIAECLTSLDELIAAEGQKLEALRSHKMGLMQNLFPREGETTPRLRFPVFRHEPEWTIRKLGELIELESGFAFSSDYFGSEGRRLVTPKNFTKSGFGNFADSLVKYTTEVAPAKYVCNPGDLLMLLTDLTPTCELLGKPLEVRTADGEVLLNQRIARVKVISQDCKKPFLKQFFLSEPYSKFIRNTASGSTVRHSSSKVIEGISFAIPASEEQCCIANCLDSLDALINALASKLDTLKFHKQSLIQGLFPSSEEAGA